MCGFACGKRDLVQLNPALTRVAILDLVRMDEAAAEAENKE